MPAVTLYDRVWAYTGTTGTGAVTPGGQVGTWRSFAAVPANAIFPYWLTEGQNWEQGLGTMNSDGTITRAVRASSATNNGPITLAGAATILIDPAAADLAILTTTGAQTFQGALTAPGLTSTAGVTSSGNVVTSGTLIASSGGSSQIAVGSGVGAGLYSDASNVAVRATTASGNIYLQNLNGANTIASFSTGGIFVNYAASFSAAVTINSNLTVSNIFCNGTVQVTGGNSFQMYNAAGATDQKYVRSYLSSNGNSYFDFVNDAYTSSTSWLIVSRSGQTPNAASFVTHVLPYFDGGYNLGSSSYRWANGYFANNPIVGSDMRIKSAPRDFDDAFLDAWGGVRWCMFQYLDAIAKKGEAHARWHCGAIAQMVRDALIAGGVDWWRFGIVCYDSWEAVEHIEQPFVPGIAAVPAVEGIPAYISERGEVLAWEVEPQDEVPAVDPIPHSVVQPGREAGNLWSLRYTQMLIAEAAWSRRETAQCRARLDAIEASVAALQKAA